MTAMILSARAWFLGVLWLAGCDSSGPAADRSDGAIVEDSGQRGDAGAGGRRDSGLSDAGGEVDGGPSGDAGAGIDAGSGSVTDSVELIFDRHFRRGFSALDPESGAVVGALVPGFASGAPAWELGQWGSATTLSAASPTTLPSGAVRWEDSYGAVTLGPSGSEEADLIFRVNAFAEYGGVYRTGSETRTWPHLLGQQRLSPPGNLGPGCPPISQLTSLRFSTEARLLRDERHIGAGYDSGRHAASFLIYFTVQNLSAPGAPGYGDFLWLGLTVYDDREPRPGLYVAGDEASGKLIYNIGLTPLTPGSLTDGAWHRLEADLLPHVRLALEAAWDRGLLTDSRDLADYRIGGMNIGWEIPGLNDAEVQVRDLSLVYEEVATTSGELRWDFDTDGDREGWTAGNLTDPTGPVGGRWVMTASAADPTLTSPPLRVDAATHGTLSVTMANAGNPAAASRMQVFWSSRSSPGFTEANSVSIDIDNGGGWATYTLDLALHPGWTGEIERLRIDPILFGGGQSVGIDSIVLAR